MNDKGKHYFEEKEVQYLKHLSECDECSYLASRESARNGATCFIAAVLILSVTLYVIILKR